MAEGGEGGFPPPTRLPRLRRPPLRRRVRVRPPPVQPAPGRPDLFPVVDHGGGAQRVICGGEGGRFGVPALCHCRTEPRRRSLAGSVGELQGGWSSEGGVKGRGERKIKKRQRGSRRVGRRRRGRRRRQPQPRDPIVAVQRHVLPQDGRHLGRRLALGPPLVHRCAGDHRHRGRGGGHAGKGARGQTAGDPRGDGAAHGEARAGAGLAAVKAEPGAARARVPALGVDAFLREREREGGVSAGVLAFGRLADGDRTAPPLLPLPPTLPGRRARSSPRTHPRHRNSCHPPGSRTGSDTCSRGTCRRTQKTCPASSTRARPSRTRPPRARRPSTPGVR